ncbi:acetyl esterase [Salana multivorans]|uniref:Acetyl esterase n=1 Tax=Salana multivorans TaxID=120377 RepID=A0A3N2D8J3_9MICO|nr:alpha/beta hydrolase fold domain-containing protein [Salana multivorans]MBN8881910.1 alpha/beta hydrolase fold domain-containing protein [Salana multivorans]OJX93812.1 MAG: hypothetical protein BGO96_09975 [Micrococcales bacterium 73-15]ROR96022.1 acetyl esterase [Salana multivorans]
MAVLDVLARTSPRQLEALAIQERLAGDAFATDAPLATMRERYTVERAFWNEGGPVMDRTDDDVVPGPAGPVAVRVHRPGPGRRGCLVYLHGGGFVLGNLDTHDRIMRTLAERSGAVVVGVDYTLSPEAKFPRAIHEAGAVVAWLAERADDLGLDGTISLAGDSGGAMLALATATWLRDTGGPAIEQLLLYYGMYGLADSASRRLYGGPWDGLTREDLAYYLDAYTGGPDDLASPYLDLLASDLSGLGACFVAAAELDPLIDDSVLLDRVLAEVGTAHELRVYDGVLHGFLHHSRVLPEALQALTDGADFYRAYRAHLAGDATEGATDDPRAASLPS